MYVCKYGILSYLLFTQSVKQLMMISLGILHSFVKEPIYHKQFLDVDYYQILIPYVHCSLLKDIRVTALCTLSYLTDYLDEGLIQFLSMSKAELEGVVAGLHEISNGADEVRFSEMNFECDEFLEAAINIAGHHGNALLLLELDAIKAVSLSHSENNIRVLFLLLIWKLTLMAVGSLPREKLDAIREFILSIAPKTKEESQLKLVLEFETLQESSHANPLAGELTDNFLSTCGG